MVIGKKILSLIVSTMVSSREIRNVVVKIGILSTVSVISCNPIMKNLLIIYSLSSLTRCLARGP